MNSPNPDESSALTQPHSVARPSPTPPSRTRASSQVPGPDSLTIRSDGREPTFRAKRRSRFCRTSLALSEADQGTRSRLADLCLRHDPG